MFIHYYVYSCICIMVVTMQPIVKKLILTKWVVSTQLKHIYDLSRIFSKKNKQAGYIIYTWSNCLVVRGFANSPGSIPGQIIPKTKKMVLDASLLNTQHYKVLFTNPSARAGYDTRSIFKQSLTGLNSEFSFS